MSSKYLRQITSWVVKILKKTANHHHVAILVFYDVGLSFWWVLFYEFFTSDATWNDSTKHFCVTKYFTPLVNHQGQGHRILLYFFTIWNYVLYRQSNRIRRVLFTVNNLTFFLLLSCCSLLTWWMICTAVSSVDCFCEGDLGIGLLLQNYVCTYFLRNVQSSK